jgi:hypothetical protein
MDYEIWIGRINLATVIRDQIMGGAAENALTDMLGMCEGTMTLLLLGASGGMPGYFWFQVDGQHPTHVCIDEKSCKSCMGCRGCKSIPRFVLKMGMFPRSKGYRGMFWALGGYHHVLVWYPWCGPGP